MALKGQTITNLVLLVLEKTVDGYCFFEDFTYHHYRYRYGIPELKKSALSVALWRLRKRGLIAKEIDNGKVMYKLTEIGRDFLPIKFDEKAWDGKWRIVVFDIPEQKRGIRDLFRRRLRDWDFKPWQKSVWVTRRSITIKLRKLISDLEIGDWVAVVESDDPALHNIVLNDRSI